jgi:hypothetical protein
MLQNNIIYSNDVRFRIEKQMEEYLISKLKKRPKSLSEARKRAEQIKYSYQIEGNQLILDNYFITDLKINFAIRK